METKVKKINPGDITIFTRFIRNFFVFEEEKLIALRNPKLYKISIFPTSLLVPVYRYSPTPLSKKLGVEFKYEDKINLENLSYFRVVKLPEDSDITIDLYLEPTDRDEEIVIWGLKVNFNDSDYSFRAFVDGTVDNDDSFSKDLKTTRWARGRSYSRYLKCSVSKVRKSIFRLEEYLFTLSNLLYIVYSGEYRKDKKEAEIFAPFTETLKGYGDTFEDALSTIKVAVLFAF
jgi:hypothetical protein